jgi:type I restriction enzyme M protein
VDVLFTNPPFGANILIDDHEVLSQYDLAAVWDRDEADGSWSIRTGVGGSRTLRRSQPPEILFIERCVQFLRPGTGRMAMVIPNGILNNPALGYVRQWMIDNTQVLAVVDMARELFQPKNDTQTSMVFMRRLSEEERTATRRGSLDYAMFMAVAEKVGHDKRGSVIYRRNAAGEDVLSTRTEVFTDIDPQTGEERLTELEVNEPLVDDELPEVAVAYGSWLEEQNA